MLKGELRVKKDAVVAEAGGCEDDAAVIIVTGGRFLKGVYSRCCRPEFQRR